METVKKRGNPNWKKGVSGNPGGRPRGWAALRAAAQAASPGALRTLISMTKKGSPAVRVAAATAILDRAYGRPETRDSADNVGTGLAIGHIHVTFTTPGKDHLEIDAVCEEPTPSMKVVEQSAERLPQTVERLPVVFRKPRGEW